MLTKIRDKATGWIAYAIVILISIPFALWGIQQYFGLDSSPVAISVDDQDITEFQLEQAILNRKQELEQAQIDFRFSEEEIKTEIIGKLVSEQLLLLAIQKYNLQTTDQTLTEFIRNRPEFKIDQRFDAALYKDILARSGFSVASFEQAQRELLKEQQLVALIQKSSFVLPSERKRYIHLADQTRKIRYLPVSYSYFIEPDSISIEQAKAHYEANKEAYRSPHKVKFDYLEIDLDELESEQVVSDEQVREYYEQRADDYLYPEKFNLRHILISTDDQDTNAALLEADRLYQQLEEGADFAELAREHSDDNLTAESGGKLPELTAEELDSDVIRDAVLELIAGEFTKPIRTQYGVQIFQLVSLIEAEQKPLDEVREELVKDIKYQMARSRYAGLIENLDLLLFEDEVGFFDAVERNYGYAKKSTEFLDINKQESILANPKIRATVISEIVQDKKTNTGLIEVEAGKRFFFVDASDVRPSVQLSFDDAMQDIMTYLILAQAHQKTYENNALWIKALLSGETSLDAIATENQWLVEDPGFIKRTETSIPRPIVEHVFTIQPSVKLPLYQTLKLDDNYNNDHIIMELLSIQPGIETSKTFVTYSLQNREAVAVLDSLRDFHDVTINVETEYENNGKDTEAGNESENETVGAETEGENEEAEAVVGDEPGNAETEDETVIDDEPVDAETEDENKEVKQP